MVLGSNENEEAVPSYRRKKYLAKEGAFCLVCPPSLLVAALNFSNGKMCCVNIPMRHEVSFRDKKMQMLQSRGIVIVNIARYFIYSHNEFVLNNEIIRKSSHRGAGAW